MIMAAPARANTRISPQVPRPDGGATSMARIIVLFFRVIGTVTCIFLLTHPFSGKSYF